MWRAQKSTHPVRFLEQLQKWLSKVVLAKSKGFPFVFPSFPSPMQKPCKGVKEHEITRRYLRGFFFFFFASAASATSQTKLFFGLLTYLWSHNSNKLHSQPGTRNPSLCLGRAILSEFKRCQSCLFSWKRINRKVSGSSALLKWLSKNILPRQSKQQQELAHQFTVMYFPPNIKVLATPAAQRDVRCGRRGWLKQKPITDLNSGCWKLLCNL